MEQFIWPNPALPPAIADDTLNPASHKPAGIAAPGAEPDALPRIVTLHDDEEPADADAWRRQFISALRDVDREDAPPPPAPEPTLEILPPLQYLAEPHRAASRASSSSRAARLPMLAPLIRKPRHRVAVPLLGAAAMVGLFSMLLPGTANNSETGKAATIVPMVLAGKQHEAAIADSAALGPVMFNAPVLVREGAAPQQAAEVAELPVIETLRTVPVFIGREAGAEALPMPWTPSASQPLAPMPAPQPAPAAAPSPLDRDSLTTLAARPPAAPQQQAEAKPPVEEPRVSQQSPQHTASHEPRAPAATQQARKRPIRAIRKADSQTRNAKWQSHRRGLRTAPPPEEPSTMVKLLKSLNPFASKEDDTAATRSQATQKKSAPKDSFWWGAKESTR